MSTSSPVRTSPRSTRPVATVPRPVIENTPFLTNYRPQFYFRTTDITGVITLPEDVAMVMPGDNVDMDVELIHPVAIEDGTKFSIREGGRTVGAGTITTIEA